jgi:hypothetical protein
MPANFRPQGVICNNYIYNDGTKESPYARLKRFLFEQDSGRTDVIFFTSAASGLEPNYSEDNAATPQNYHCTGGIADGIAKAIIQGNPSIGRPGRSLYATGVKMAYESNLCPNFDPWNSATWSNPNPTGAGGFLAGCATAYDSYFYYTRGTKQQTGYSYFSLPVLSVNNNTQQIQWNPETQEYTLYSWKDFIGSAFFPLQQIDYLNNNNSRNDKFQGNYARGFSTSNTVLENNIKYFDSTDIVPVNFSQMPEQPQRFWDRAQYYIQKEDDVLEVGIGYVKDGVVETLFNTHASYIPAGLAVGQTEATVLANHPNSIRLTSTQVGTSFSAWDAAFSTLGEMANQSTSWKSSGRTDNETQTSPLLFQPTWGRKIIVRKVTINEIITIKGLNILSSAPANKAAFEASDGYRLGTYVIFRWMWANPPTIGGPDLQPLANKFMQHYNLALTSIDSDISPEQNNLPYLRTFGMKSHIYSTSAWNITQWATKVGAVVQDVPSQVKGLPVVLSSVNPAGFFALTKLDIAELTGTSPSPTINRDRCLLIRPSLGLFHAGIVSSKGGLSPTTRQLTTAEKNNLLGIFKSPDFTYVTRVYTIPSYTGSFTNFPERKSGTTTYPVTQIVFTAHEKTIGNGATLTQIRSPLLANAFLDGQPVFFTTDANDAVQRKAAGQYAGIECNLQSINNNWTKSELRFGFLGKDSSDITMGTFAIGAHFGIDRSNPHGIAFTKMDSSFAFRTGDIGYNFDNGANQRAFIYLETFKTIRDRQYNSELIFTFPGQLPFNNNQESGEKPRKLIIFYEIGVWESANPNASYLGFNTYQYIAASRLGPNNQRIATGWNYLNSTGVHAISPIDAFLRQAGWTEEEYVIVFYTPSHLTTVQTHSVNSNTNPQSLINNITSRSSFIRASEIFSNNILNGKGLYNFGPSATVYNDIKIPGQFAHLNSCYINFGSIPTISATLSQANVEPNASDWYVSSVEDVDYTKFTPAGCLAVGSMLLDYLYSATNPTVNFVPPWIPPFSKMLNYTTDPVSGADFAFVTVSTDPVDIKPYLVELDAIIDNQGNSANDQATRTLCYFKTKTLQ